MICYGLSSQEYFSNENHGSTALKTLAYESAADFKAMLEMNEKETSSQSLGTLWHTILLEPHLLPLLYIHETEDLGDRKSGKGKKQWDAVKAEAKESGKTPVKYCDWQRAMLFQDTIQDYPYLQRIVKKGKAEVSAFTEFEGVPIKARADLLLVQDNIIWDVKTTSDNLTEHALARTVKKWHYDFQAAHYIQTFMQNNIDVQHWGWIFISTKKSGIHISLMKADPAWIEKGFHDFMYAIDLYNECEETGIWPGQGNDEPLTLFMPE